jgi:hypothetical protein
VEAALDLPLAAHRHVVAQVVEAELVVGAVGDVRGVLLALVGGVEVTGDDQADAEAQPAVQPAHPLGVAGGQVVVDGDEVGPAAAEAVEVGRKGRDERLALTGLHLGDPAEVEGGTADQLDVVVALAQHPLARLADHRERLDEEVVEVLAALEALAELACLGLEGRVVQPLHLRLEGGDVRRQRLQRLELLPLARAEDLVEDSHEGPEPTGYRSRIFSRTA